jgi:hypothetical protein
MSPTLTDEAAPNLGQDAGQKVANYLRLGIDPGPVDALQDIESQDTASYNYGTVIKGARVPSTYMSALSIWEPVKQVQNVQLGFVAAPAVQWAFSDRALASLSRSIRTWLKDYETPADFLTFAFTFAEAIEGRDLMRDSLSVKNEVQDLVGIGPHVRLPPKRRREIQVKLEGRRKGQPLAIKREDL